MAGRHVAYGSFSLLPSTAVAVCTWVVGGGTGEGWESPHAILHTVLDAKTNVGRRAPPHGIVGEVSSDGAGPLTASCTHATCTAMASAAQAVAQVSPTAAALDEQPAAEAREGVRQGGSALVSTAVGDIFQPRLGGFERDSPSESPSPPFILGCEDPRIFFVRFGAASSQSFAPGRSAATPPDTSLVRRQLLSRSPQALQRLPPLRHFGVDCVPQRRHVRGVSLLLESSPAAPSISDSDIPMISSRLNLNTADWVEAMEIVDCVMSARTSTRARARTPELSGTFYAVYTLSAGFKHIRDPPRPLYHLGQSRRFYRVQIRTFNTPSKKELVYTAGRKITASAR